MSFPGNTVVGSQPSTGPSVFVLIAISMVAPVAMNIYLPSMSGMVEAFETSSAYIQLTMSLYFAAVALSQIVTGPLSDRFGRRPVVLYGLGLFCLASVGCLMVRSVEGLLFFRVLQAIGASSGLVLARAIVRDVYGRDRAASMIGYVTMGMTVGPLVAPALGGFLDGPFGWRGGFYVMIAMGFAVFAAAVFLLPETNSQRQTEGGMKALATSYRSLVVNPAFRAYALIAMFTSAVYFCYLGGAPYLAAGRLGLSPQVIGIYFMFVAAGYLVGNGLSGRYAQRIGLTPMIVVGSILPTLAVIAIALLSAFSIEHALVLFLPMFLVGVGNGLCLPSTLAGAVSARPDLAGAASGMTGSLQIGCGAGVSALVAWMLSDDVWPNNIWPMLILMLVCMAASWVYVVKAARTET